MKREVEFRRVCKMCSMNGGVLKLMFTICLLQRCDYIIGTNLAIGSIYFFIRTYFVEIIAKCLSKITYLRLRTQKKARQTKKGK